MASSFSDWLSTLWYGDVSQVATEYTEEQSALANSAWASGQSVLSSLGTDISNLSSSYQSYLDSLSSTDLYSQATSDEAMAGYATTIDQILSNYSGSLLAQAETEGQKAAAQAAETYNLAGAGGLYSGAAASAIAEGAATPITEAYTAIAEKQSDLYSSLIGSNLSSLSDILGYQVSGAATLYGTEASALTSAAAASANLYGSQASSYDTEAVFQEQEGLSDYLMAALGGISSLFGSSSSSSLGDATGLSSVSGTDWAGLFDTSWIGDIFS